MERQINNLLNGFENKTPIEKRGTLLEVVTIYQESRYPWRARKYIKPLLDLVDQIGDDKNLSCFEMVARFYMNAHDFVGLYHLYLKKYEYLKAKENPNAYIALGKALEWRNIFPYELKPDLDFDEIYLDNPNNIDYLKQKQTKSPFLKVDPVEFSEEFQKVFDEVMEEVEQEIDKEKDLHIPQQRWGIMAEKFADRGIDWRSPDLMNPGVMFD